VEKTIRIITCNVPVAYLNAIDKLVTNNKHQGLYPSRSELVRIAVREFLLKELEAAKEFERLNYSAKNETVALNDSEEVKSVVFWKKIKTP